MNKPALVDLKARRINADCLTMLRDLISQVESGDIVAVVAVGMMANGEVIDGWSPGQYNRFAMLGAIEAIKRDYLAREIESRA